MTALKAMQSGLRTNLVVELGGGQGAAVAQALVYGLTLFDCLVHMRVPVTIPALMQSAV